MLRCCKQTMQQACSDFGAGLAGFSGEDNHAYLLVTYPPKAAVPAPVNSLKRVSARQPRSESTGRVNRYPMHGHSWPPSHFAATPGGGAAEHHPPVHRAAEPVRLIPP
jgi:putative transposase